jgi:hypothetical protein
METIEKLYQHTFPLNDGREIPALGFGTSLSDRNQTRAAVKTAVEVGFRHLDAAERYRNEAEIGTGRHTGFRISGGLALLRCLHCDRAPGTRTRGPFPAVKLRCNYYVIYRPRWSVAKERM